MAITYNSEHLTNVFSTSKKNLQSGSFFFTKWLFVDTFHKYDRLNLRIIIKFMGFRIWYSLEAFVIDLEWFMSYEGIYYP